MDLLGLIIDTLDPSTAGLAIGNRVKEPPLFHQMGTALEDRRKITAGVAFHR